MRTPVQARRARAVLTVTAIGMSSVVFSLGGVANAATPSWTATADGLQAPIPAGICAVDWVVTGGSGGGAGAPFGGLLEVTTPVSEGDTFELFPGTAGEPASGTFGGAGGTNGSPTAGEGGDEGLFADPSGSGGGGAASTVYLADLPFPFLLAFGGNGLAGEDADGPVDGGLGGGGGVNSAAAGELTTEQETALASAAGDGSITGTGVLCDVANAPTGLSATPGDGRLEISFTPGATGPDVDEVTGWEISTDGGANYVAFTPAVSDGVSSTVVDGLTNGTAYSVSVRAIGAVGPGTSATTTGTPVAPVAAVPAAPVLAGLTSGFESLVVDFAAGSDADRPEATSFQYSLDGGAWTAFATAPTADGFTGEIAGLENGTTYAVRVRGVAGASGELEGDPSLPLSGIAQDVPNAPTDVAVAAGDQQLGLTFKAGADTGVGMADPDGWEVSTDGGTSFGPLTASADPQTNVVSGTVEGLTNGETYSVVLRATSPVGEGRPSVPMPGTPAAPVVVVVTPPVDTPTVVTPTPVAPSAPYMNWAMGDNRSLEISFTDAPSAPGVPAPTSYEYRLGGTGAWTALPTSLEDGRRYGIVNGLTNGTVYTVQVRALAGGLASEPSGTATATPRYVLPNPAGMVATVLPGALKVSWSAPAGGVGITGYEVHAIPGAEPQSDAGRVSCTTGPADLDCVLPVPAGERYSVVVFGVTAEGPGKPTFLVSDVVPAVQKPAAVPTKDDGDLTGASGPITGVTAGEKIVLRGSGYLPGSTVQLLVYSSPVSLGTVVAGPDGSFTIEVTLPADLAAGTHHLVATGVDADGNVRNLVVTVTVDASGTATVTQVTPAGDGGLAYTGADIAVPAIGGLAALAIGGGLVVAGKRRRAAE